MATVHAMLSYVYHKLCCMTLWGNRIPTQQQMERYTHLQALARDCLLACKAAMLRLDNWTACATFHDMTECRGNLAC